MSDDPQETQLLNDMRVVLDRRSDPGTVALPCEVLEGRQIGPYLVGKRLGEGGMARVYRALDTQNGRDVAFKVLKAPYHADENIRARFEREARSMARIHHDHVVRIFGLTDETDVRAIVMELLPGGSLRDRLRAISARKLGMDIPEAVTLIAQAARGIGAAHRMGMVHRDVKPSNLLFDQQGRIKVADFGAIRVLEETTWLTSAGQQIGTPAYMSPEQCAGKPVTPASDVYSLTVTLFELIVGWLPFSAEDSSPFAIMLKHISEPPSDPRNWRGDIPEWLAAIILNNLQKNPSDRHPRGDELADALLAGAAAATPAASEPEVRLSEVQVDLAAISRQLRQLPLRAIVCWACRCARRVQVLNDDPRLERALSMAEATYAPACELAHTPDSVARALSKIQSLRTASLKAAYADLDAQQLSVSQAAAEAAKSAAAAAACAAARCIEDAAADAAFAARSALSALEDAEKPVKPFWTEARADYDRLLKANLGTEGSIGQPIPSTFFC
jgi:serine/threonine protein kinase